jgi:hypothetical protein
MPPVSHVETEAVRQCVLPDQVLTMGVLLLLLVIPCMLEATNLTPCKGPRRRRVTTYKYPVVPPLHSRLQSPTAHGTDPFRLFDRDSLRPSCSARAACLPLFLLPDMAARPVALALPLLALVCALAASADATQFRVGGQSGWSVPGAGSEPYNTWAGRLRFQIGDQLRK